MDSCIILWHVFLLAYSNWGRSPLHALETDNPSGGLTIHFPTDFPISTKQILRDFWLKNKCLEPFFLYYKYKIL